MKFFFQLMFVYIIFTFFLLDVSIAQEYPQIFNFSQPQKFEKVQHLKKGNATVTAYASNPRENGTRAAITITIMDFSDISDEKKDEMPDEQGIKDNFEKFIGSVKATRTNWKQSKVKTEKIGGLNFSTAIWEGTAQGMEMKGQYYVARRGDKFIMIGVQDVVPHVEKSFDVMIKAVKSFRMK